LFTPLALQAIFNLSETTWPIQTVFRLWLENINWVSNAETGSGPTPCHPPVYADFLRGIRALQRLQDRTAIRLFSEQQEEIHGKVLSEQQLTGADMLAAAQAGYEYRKEPGGTWTLLRKKPQAVLRVNPAFLGDPDLLEFCHAFRLQPGLL